MVPDVAAPDVDPLTVHVPQTVPARIVSLTNVPDGFVQLKDAVATVTAVTEIEVASNGSVVPLASLLLIAPAPPADQA